MDSPAAEIVSPAAGFRLFVAVNKQTLQHVDHPPVFRQPHNRVLLYTHLDTKGIRSSIYTPIPRRQVRTMAASPRNPKACLLGLPGELRNRILLDVATSAAFNPDGDRNDVNFPYAESSLKVLFRSFYINKQLFHELSALFNGNNRFGLCAKPTSVARQIMLLCDKRPSDAEIFTDRLLARRTLTEIRSYFTKDTYIAYDMNEFGKFKGLHLPHTATRSSIRHVRMFVPLPISLLVSDVFYEDIFGGG
ncbi:hypothetical protein M409DRAFT_53981 [Zasmidium cellare ATCC 36951]|uniref:Uncharacterized protein n=1 Tax=Zasmidium cellare ATCC 36951 TaxID=1080233 RepID=A0A6A6CJG7_ZASCE|nr:uncharacterized protein M409DRAFT_53981 [Zasmidium cellare ATCC 36951]KAF2167377.1 hypothetical protein M409DRAFT_53981 [Zasmidium cellare ATCC 36951]